MKITDKRNAGLAEVEVGDDKRVYLTLYPPGGKPVGIKMTPEEARALAQGLTSASHLCEAGPTDGPVITGLPET